MYFLSIIIEKYTNEAILDVNIDNIINLSSPIKITITQVLRNYIII